MWKPTREIWGKTVEFDTKFCEGIAYKQMWEHHPFKNCWGCGQSGRRSPIWWGGPWLCERAHIVNQPRKKDRRAVILLCSECHKETHINQFPDGQKLKVITVEHMLWLKLQYDPWFFDRKFLESCCVGKLPPSVRIGEYRRRLVQSRCGDLAYLNDGERQSEIQNILTAA